ncbi:MAG: PorT family protein [Lunatimonas sp.]|uniref:porin family protein n=1 Tax=Lunatimonas sp. TaxID=2060141 RepID=UPI00263B650C|nr:porin family protein [Lunatimonas sp.]MCC5939678.1 PorT family protein [Lunatimonas sp.]
MITKTKNPIIGIAFGCIFALFTVQVQAQEFSIGPKFGISQGDIRVNGEGFTTGESKLGYHLGLFARLGGNRIFLQPEILYTNTGGEIQSSQNQSQVNYAVSFNRIDTPILFGFKIANFFRIQAGPALSFLINSDVDTNTTGVPLPDYNQTTLGYQAGIGVDIANMILDLKYEGPIGKQADSIAGFPTDQRQNQLILSLGIRLF